MAGLNNIRGAYEQVYVQLNESLVRDRAKNAVADDRLDAEQEKTNASMDKLRAQTKRHSKSTALDRARAQIAAKKSEDTARSMHPKPRTSGYRIEEFDQLDERMSDDEKEMRRLAAQERRAGKSDRLDSKVGAKYAESEKKSAEREDKKSRGKHIHGMADSFELEGDIVEKKDDSYLETDMEKRRKNNEKAIEDMKKTKAHADMVKAARKHFEEVIKEEDPCWKGYTQVGMKKKNGREVPNCVPSKGVPKAKGYKKEELELDERALDTAETGEKERLVKGMKKSAADFKKRYGERAKSVMYATATKMAKKHMDTSKSDRRYAVEETSMEENADLENRKVGPRKPSQIAKREKLNKLIDEIRSKKEGESK